MVAKTSWAASDMDAAAARRRAWADPAAGEGEPWADLEGEATDDEPGETDASWLAAELAAIEGELAALRRHYRRALPRLDDASAGARAVAGRRLGRLLRMADELLAARATLVA